MAGDENKDPLRPPEPPDLRSAFATLLNPVTLVAIVIILGVMFLLLMAIMGWDKGRVLATMAQPDFARGVITYLFTVVTIGTAILLIISGLTGGHESKERFDRGKEILGLLLGVFGTMVGFYFGSEVAHPHVKLGISTPLLGNAQSGEQMQVTALIQGGTPPYHLGIAIGDQAPRSYPLAARSDGWIQSLVPIPSVPQDQAATLWMAVQDGNLDVATTSTGFVEKAKAAN
jgi:hypothetical protein